MNGEQRVSETQLSIKHLTGLEGVPADDIRLILDTADSFREILERPIKKVPTLTGVTVLNFFYEASTRTRLSFEMAEKRLNADVVNFSTSTSRRGASFFTAGVTTLYPTFINASVTASRIAMSIVFSFWAFRAKGLPNPPRTIPTI